MMQSGEQQPDMVMAVSDFVAVMNQTLEYSFAGVMITGELANFRVSKGKWVYFDLKDEFASVRCFGTVYLLPGPLEDGMLVTVRAVPRLHPQFGFSLNLSSIQAAGAGSIRRAAELLEAKLAAEGLFEPSRKRLLPYPPQRIGLVASGESAAYVDFLKVLQGRWGGLEIIHVDVQVQGEAAPGQIVAAIEQLNELQLLPDVLVITRGGGSAEDLQAFSSERVTRAVAASRVPTLVAIGHEIDVSLAELAADQRASTPSNAAELLVPDRAAVSRGLHEMQRSLQQTIEQTLSTAREQIILDSRDLQRAIEQKLSQVREQLTAKEKLLTALSPQAVLQRGYAIVRRDQAVIRTKKQLHKADTLQVQFVDGTVTTTVEDVN